MFILINKPSGPTSHDIISRLRKITGLKRIGHAGTLDPFAQGLLICALGRESTKFLDNFLKLDKTYLATLQLGATSDTYDRTGKISVLPYLGEACPPLASPSGDGPPASQARALRAGRRVPSANEAEGYRRLTKKQISSTLQKFIGQQLQTPPIFSAKKINGKTAYQLARQGKAVNLKPNKINIYDIKLKKFKPQTITPLSPLPLSGRGLGRGQLEIEINCSSGTYIRSLAHDLGQALGCGALLEKLIRTQIGPYWLKDAVPLDKLTPDNWQTYLTPVLAPRPSKTRVLVFGTFDLLHPGHLNFLHQAKKLGDELYVVIARDPNVKTLKKISATQDELTRQKAVKNSAIANDVMLGQLDFARRFRVLGRIKPDIIALGYDQKIDPDALTAKIKHYNLATEIVRLQPYHPEIYKSSLLRKKATTLAKSPIL